MVTIDLVASAGERGVRRRRALEDVRHRLVALAADLESLDAEEAALRRTIAELEAIVRRIRWVADVCAEDPLVGT